MRILSLQVENLRVIEGVQIEPCGGLNLITGANGAGKTSLLEAIYLAGRGRTFRHAEAGPMIRQGADSTRVVVKFENAAQGRQSVLGVQRERKRLVCRLDGQEVVQRSGLAAALPVQWVGSQPQQLLSMGPDIRRRFIDMGLFHVEPSFFTVLKAFQRAYRQRNAAIREGLADEVRHWDPVFADASEQLSACREGLVEALMRRTMALIRDWDPGFKVDFRYRRGWADDVSLVEQLGRKTELDMRMGFTTVGPQRAELEIVTDSGLLAERQLSLGQQKLLVLALNIALLDVLTQRRGLTPIFLVDDLGAELDHGNRKRALTEILNRRAQVFIATIENNLSGERAENTKVFHVEHGVLSRCAE